MRTITIVDKVKNIVIKKGHSHTKVVVSRGEEGTIPPMTFLILLISIIIIFFKRKLLFSFTKHQKRVCFSPS